MDSKSMDALLDVLNQIFPRDPHWATNSHFTFKGWAY